VDTLSYKTKSANKDTVERKWWIVDAEGQTLGRMASQLAIVLRGKNKPYYTPHVDCGDFIIVINAEKVRLSGKKIDKKVYFSHSGYPGGVKTKTTKEILESRPEVVIEKAIRGMLPKNKLGRAMFKKLYVYAGAEHDHVAQKPATLEV